MRRMTARFQPISTFFKDLAANLLETWGKLEIVRPLLNAKRQPPHGDRAEGVRTPASPAPIPEEIKNALKTLRKGKTPAIE